MIRWIWKLGGRLDNGASYFFYLLGEDHEGRHIVPDGRIVSVADFWAGRVA